MSIIENPVEARRQKNEYNKAYHAKRWANDASYREKKRETANTQRLDPDYNKKRREARKRKPQEQIEDEIARSRRWALAHVESMRAGRLRRNYNLTPQDVEQMLADQGNSCRLCQIQFTDKKKYKIDHCHKSGAVRGLLCNSCNTALGKFKDDPSLLRRAASYVEGSD